jgi:hypothetical protein
MCYEIRRAERLVWTSLPITRGRVRVVDNKMLLCYFLFLQEQIKGIIIITAVPIIKLFARGERDSEGHVL